jgi:hypothetical protein
LARWCRRGPHRGERAVGSGAGAGGVARRWWSGRFGAESRLLRSPGHVDWNMSSRGARERGFGAESALKPVPCRRVVTYSPPNDTDRRFGPERRPRVPKPTPSGDRGRPHPGHLLVDEPDPRPRRQARSRGTPPRRRRPPRRLQVGCARNYLLPSLSLWNSASPPSPTSRPA